MKKIAITPEKKNNPAQVVTPKSPADASQIQALRVQCNVGILVLLADNFQEDPNEPFAIGKVRAGLGESGRREIYLTLRRTHPIVTSALKRNDRALLRFLTALVLCEWFCWWRDRRDARLVREYLLQRSGITSENGFKLFWTSLATMLAGSELLSQLTLSNGPQELASFDLELREKSDIPRWRSPQPVQPTTKDPTSADPNAFGVGSVPAWGRRRGEV